MGDPTVNNALAVMATGYQHASGRAGSPPQSCPSGKAALPASRRGLVSKRSGQFEHSGAPGSAHLFRLLSRNPSTAFRYRSGAEE
jgi:hypothetical protein